MFHKAIAVFILSTMLCGVLFAQTSNVLPNKPEPQKPVADRTFALWSMASGAATVLDLATTRHAISSCGLRETNPIYGRNPGNARMALIGGGLTAAQIGISYFLKKRNPHSKAWMFPMIGNTGVHLAGMTNNLARCH